MRLERGGKVTEYPTPPSLEYPGDIVEGPDGAMWFTANDIGRIDSNGRITSHQRGGPVWPGAITADDEGLWYPSDGPEGQPLLERMSTEGVVTASFRLGGAGLWTKGIALGQDGALWLTHEDFEELSDSIGRMGVDGHYTSWPLPQDRSGPERITAGPDGALWFTEQAGQRIGRITPAGEITEFPLEPGLSPYDIAAGADGALWFTTDTCLGRITTEGQVTMFPVAGAVELVGIADVPDGSFWLADRLGHALRHVTPPDPAVAESACQPPTIVAKEGATEAVLTYKRLDVLDDGDEHFTNGHLRISRRGKELLGEVVPSPPEARTGYRVFGYTRSALAVRDLDGDREPEVLLRFNWNGTHCCEWSRIFRFDDARSRYVAVHHFWGNADTSPTLRDLDNDGRPEFISKDDRFAQLIGYAAHISPVQVWSYRQGEFRDVTRSHPKVIANDAARLWRLYEKYRGKGTVRYVLAAWAADELMLGRPEAVEQVFAEAVPEGYLAPRLGESEDAAGYVAMTKRFLREAGYIDD